MASLHRSTMAIANLRLPSLWEPIDGLRVVDADTTVVLINSGAVSYAQQVLDPVFRATSPTRRGSAWFPDVALATIACIDQHQYCNPVNGSCTAVNGSCTAVNGTMGEYSSPFVYEGVSSPQLSTARRINEYSSGRTICNSIRALGSNGW